jgi:hypothetical protein
MFVFLSRSRHGPLLQVTLGLAIIVIGLFVMTRILLPAGGLLVVWGIFGGVRRLRARGREGDESGGGG